MHVPCAAETVERLENDEALVRRLLLQMPSRADAGDTGPDDQDVEMLQFSRPLGRRPFKRFRSSHFLPLYM